MTTSLLRNLLLAFLGFGILMGAVFPFYAGFFVEFLPGMKAWFVIGCLVAGTSIGIINYLLLRTLLLKRLQQIAAVANAISQRDLRGRCELRSADVIGDIIDSFNRMGDTLSGVVSTLQQHSHNIEHGIADIRENAALTASAMDQQQEETTTAGSAVQQMVNFADNVSRTSADTAREVSNSRQRAEQGASAVNESLAALQTLTADMEAATGTIHQVESESQNIEGVISVIQGISAQTNLLALNAAIEAARAGEQGRGFAVVADEVRTLAQRTQEATEEIQRMIANLQKVALDMVAGMNRNRTQADDSLSRAQLARDVLQEISQAMQSTQAAIGHLVSDSGEQNRIAADIEQAMARMLVLTDDCRQRSGQTSHSSRQLEDIASSLNQFISSFRC